MNHHLLGKAPTTQMQKKHGTMQEHRSSCSKGVMWVAFFYLFTFVTMILVWRWEK